MIEVKAIQKGFFLQYREIGDVFAIPEERMFSRNWMERLSPPPVVEVKKPELVAAPVAVAAEDKPKRKYVKKQKVETKA